MFIFIYVFRTIRCFNFMQLFSFRWWLQSYFYMYLVWSLNAFQMTMDKYYICVKNILTHARKVTCCICHKLFHVKCISLSPEYMISIQDNSESWYCTYCIQTVFPFNNIEDDIDFFAEIEQSSSPDKSLMYLSDNLLIPFELKITPKFWVKLIPIYITLTRSTNLATIVIIFCRVNLTHSSKRETLQVMFFSVCHINIRSLKKNLTDFEILICSLINLPL